MFDHLTTTIQAATVDSQRKDGVVLELADGNHAYLSNDEIAKLRRIDHAYAISVDDTGAHIALRHGPRIELTPNVLARIALAHRRWAVDGKAVSA